MKQVDVVGAVIVRPDGAILCARRGPGMAMAGLWEFPGGKIEPGESPAQCLRREIWEELGCTIRVGDPIADITHTYPSVVVRLITCWAWLEEGQPTAREHDELRWVTPDHLSQLNWAPADIPTVHKIGPKRDPSPATGTNGDAAPV